MRRCEIRLRIHAPSDWGSHVTASYVITLRRHTPNDLAGQNQSLRAWQTGDADSGPMGLVTHIQPDHQCRDLLHDADIFQFSAINRTYAGKFLGEFTGN